jgi:hypothetical protein
MGLFDRFRGNDERTQPKQSSAQGSPKLDIDPAAVADSILHPSSFSVVAFAGDHRMYIPGLLAECDYVLLRQGTGHGTPVGLRDALRPGPGTDRSIVLKAFWSSADMTVLIDPEMVLAFLNEDQIVAFCRERATRAVAAVWERVSESAILVEFDGSGKTRHTCYVGRVPEGDQREPRAEMVESPDQHGLRRALGACGFSEEQLFAEAEVTVLELKE